jgi:hypothetical protein
VQLKTANYYRHKWQTCAKQGNINKRLIIAMEEYKIINWEKDNIDIKYTSFYETLYKNVFDDITKMYHLKTNFFANNSFFCNMSNVLKNEIILLSINEQTGFADLLEHINLQISHNEDIVVIWNYNEVDSIKCKYLKKYWDYIWYGVSDEMCLIYIPRLKKLFHITEYGTINW